MRALWLLASIIGLALTGCGSPDPSPQVFAPPYPETTARGDVIQAVYEGRIPCHLSGCNVRKVQLVLYQDADSAAPARYWLGVVHVGRGNDRAVTEGGWTVQRGIQGYPRAEAIVLDAAVDDDLRHFWRVNGDVLLLLDNDLRPVAGDAAWGTTLSRYPGTYGPRVYP